jgi:hypothetical protein
MGVLSLRILAVFVGLSVFFPFSAAALIAVGNLDIPGVTESIVVVDGVAYVVGGDTVDPGDSGLRVIDVSDPTAPVEIGAVDTPGHASQAVVVDGLAYVGDSSADGVLSSLRTINVSNPAAPVEVGAIDIPRICSSNSSNPGGVCTADGDCNGGFCLSGSTVSDLAVDGGFAYVVDTNFAPRNPYAIITLRVFDVSNPAAPVELDPIGITERPSGIDVVDGLAYVALGVGGNSGLLIIDVSNPAAPVELGSLDTVFVEDVEVAGGVAYGISSQSSSNFGGLQLIDISNPAAPVELGSVNTATGENVAVAGGFAYLASRFGLGLVDVSNPAAPVALSGTLDPTSGARDVAAADGLAYVVGVAGLAVVDLSNPAFPAELGTFNIQVGELFSGARAVAVADGLAYVAARVSGSPDRSIKGSLQVIDVSNPAAPVGLINPLFAGESRGVAEGGGLAYVAVGNNPRFSVPSSLRVIDPALGQRDSLYFPTRLDDVAVAGGLAYVVGSSLQVIDASLPLSPLGSLDTPGVDVAIAGELAHVVADFSLRTIDVSNPAAPVEVGAINTPGRASAVAVAGGLVYVGVENSSVDLGSLRVIDVSIPAAPAELGAISLFDRVTNVAVVGGLAYVATGGSGLRLVDVSNPTAPVDLGGVGGFFEDVAAADGLAYVVGGVALRIIDFGPEYTESIQIEIDIKPGSDPNSINPSLEGDLPVAILGSDSFDVADVNVTTLAFGPSGASIDHSQGPHFEDLNGDGFVDLMAHFRIEKTGIAFGNRMACLSAEMLDGTPINGCDDVRTVPDMDGDQLLDVQEATIGTHSLNPDTDGDGFTDGQEVHLMGTDPLNAKDPKPVRKRKRRGTRRR